MVRFALYFALSLGVLGYVGPAGAAHAGGPRAQHASKLETRLLLSRSQGGTVARAGGNVCAPLSACSISFLWAPQACCGVVRNVCCDVSALSGAVAEVSAAPPTKPAIACTS